MINCRKISFGNNRFVYKNQQPKGIPSAKEFFEGNIEKGSLKEHCKIGLLLVKKLEKKSKEIEENYIGNQLTQMSISLRKKLKKLRDALKKLKQALAFATILSEKEAGGVIHVMKTTWSSLGKVIGEVNSSRIFLPGDPLAPLETVSLDADEVLKDVIEEIRGTKGKKTKTKKKGNKKKRAKNERGERPPKVIRITEAEREKEKVRNKPITPKQLVVNVVEKLLNVAATKKPARITKDEAGVTMSWLKNGRVQTVFNNGIRYNLEKSIDGNWARLRAVGAGGKDFPVIRLNNAASGEEPRWQEKIPEDAVVAGMKKPEEKNRVERKSLAKLQEEAAREREARGKPSLEGMGGMVFVKYIVEGEETPGFKEAYRKMEKFADKNRPKKTEIVKEFGLKIKVKPNGEIEFSRPNYDWSKGDDKNEKRQVYVWNEGFSEGGGASRIA